MKTPIFALALLLLGGQAMAGDSPRSDAPHDTLRADTDGDGRVSRAEAEAASSKKSTEWFDKLDTNKDGYVTQEEVSQAKATRRADMKARFDERFKEADANNDGQLSLDEAVQMAQRRYKARAVKAEIDSDGEHRIYVIRLLNDSGRVWTSTDVRRGVLQKATLWPTCRYGLILRQRCSPEITAETRIAATPATSA